MAIAAFNGRYNIIGNPQDADCVIGQSFGAREGEPGCVNELLARYVIEQTPEELPLLLQHEIAEALPDQTREPALIVEGGPSTAGGGGLDSWGVLLKAHEYMEKHGLSKPMLVAQAFHAGRIEYQARRLNMRLIVPAGLPREFDPLSTQPWTTSRREWIKRENPIGFAYLKLQRKL